MRHIAEAITIVELVNMYLVHSKHFAIVERHRSSPLILKVKDDLF